MSVRNIDVLAGFVHGVQGVERRTCFTEAELAHWHVLWQEIQAKITLEKADFPCVSDLLHWLGGSDMKNRCFTAGEVAELEEKYRLFNKIIAFLDSFTRRINQLETTATGEITNGSPLEDDWREVNAQLHRHYQWFHQLTSEEISALLDDLLQLGDVRLKSELMQLVIRFQVSSEGEVIRKNVRTVVINARTTRRDINLLCGGVFGNEDQLAILQERMKCVRNQICMATARVIAREHMH